MTRTVVFATLALALSLAAPADARAYVQDGAGMFSKQAIDQVNQRIVTFNEATGKEIVVVTVPSLGGASLQDGAAKAFAEQHVNGVLIFIARDDRRDIIVPDRAGADAGWFTPEVLRNIRGQMEREFHNEAFDSGLLYAVDGVMQVYGQHMQGNAAPGAAAAPNRAGAPAAAPRLPSSGVHISMFWWIVIIVVGFLILRSVMRAFSTPRYGPPGAAPGTPPPAGYRPGYGPGYGGGYGGGGSFWSGLLGGLGGAWLGNEMFGNRGGGGIAPADASQTAAPDSGGGWSGDTGGGWQSDAGQADMSGASGGDWSGGGFGDSGGGDFGGGDSGGGGGDSGGGW